LKKLLNSIFLSPTKRRLASNFLSLSIIQGANYLVPLLILPYIVRIIGPENFGVLNYSQSFVYYFTIIINYGFDLTATREISVNRDDRAKVSLIYSTVFCSKLILLGAATIVFLASVGLVDKFKQHIELYFLTYLINIGFLFFPSWYYQGTENLTKTALFNFLTKVVFAGLVLLLIHDRTDFYIYALSTSLAQVFVGILAFIYPLQYLSVNLVTVTWHNVKQMLRGGLSIFYSNIAVSLYTTTNLIILGFYTSETEYGFFSASLKVAQVIQSLVILPMSITLFPHIAKSFSDSQKTGLQTVFKYLKLVAIFTLLLASVVFFFAEKIITLLFGEEFIASVLYLRIMSFIPFVSGMNIMISVQGLLNMKRDREFLQITIFTLVTSMILNFIFVPIYKGMATAFIQLFLEFFSITLASFYLYKSIKVTSQIAQIS
jgi:O-antigen/teichoic acid export membrane protein